MNKILNYLEDDNWYKIFDAENEEDIEYKLLEREEVETLLKEIERLNNKVEELMELYTTERHCKDDYKAIIKEIENYVNKTHMPKGYKEYILQVIKENKDDNY